MVDDTFNRVERPPKEDKQFRSFFLWKPDDANDQVVEERKIVSSFNIVAENNYEIILGWRMGLQSP